ncbi:MAG: hypothetical protein ABWY20_21165 [Mycobacterium sp.]
MTKRKIHALLGSIALGGAIAAGLIGPPSAQAGPITCDTDYYGDIDCHWTDSEGNRHKTTESCYGSRCTIRQVY